VVCQRSSNHKL